MKYLQPFVLVSVLLVSSLSTKVHAMIPTPGTIGSGGDKPKPTSAPQTASALDSVLATMWKELSTPAFIILTFIAITVIAWAGYRYISSAGDPAKMKEAQATLVQAVLGVALVTATAFVLMVIISFAQGVVTTVDGTDTITPPIIKQ